AGRRYAPRAFHPVVTMGYRSIGGSFSSSGSRGVAAHIDRRIPRLPVPSPAWRADWWLGSRSLRGRVALGARPRHLVLPLGGRQEGPPLHFFGLERQKEGGSDPAGSGQYHLPWTDFRKE